MFQLITIGDPVIDTHVQLDHHAATLTENEDGGTDLSLPYGKKIPIANSFQALGGNAANVAAGAVRLGLKSAIITTIGNDGLGTIAHSLLQHAGVDTSLISVDPHCTTRYSIVLNYEAERTILSYASQRKYVWPSSFPGTDWIYFTGLSSGFEHVQDGLIDYLNKHKSVRLAINPGSWMLEHNLDSLHSLLKRADLIILNLEEAETLAETTLRKEKSIATLIHRLLAFGPREVVITDAGRGAWAGNDEMIWHHASFPVTVVAKTGAGDAFSSGYIAARFYGHDIPHALSWGIANSSATIREHGSQTGLADKNTLEIIREEYKHITPDQVR